LRCSAEAGGHLLAPKPPLIPVTLKVSHALLDLCQLLTKAYELTLNSGDAHCNDIDPAGNKIDPSGEKIDSIVEIAEHSKADQDRAGENADHPIEPPMPYKGKDAKLQFLIVRPNRRRFRP
jgi:hypothetical protein